MLPCLSTDSRNGRFEQIIKNNKGGAKGGRKSTPHLTEIAMGEGAGSHRPGQETDRNWECWLM